MLNLGMSEILIFSIIALIVLGPEKLPIALKTVAKWYVRIKKFVTNVQQDIEKEFKISELREQMQDEIKRIEALEQQMQEKFAAMERQQNEFLQQQLKQKAIRYDYLEGFYQVPFQASFDARVLSQLSQPIAINPVHTTLKVAV